MSSPAYKQRLSEGGSRVGESVCDGGNCKAVSSSIFHGGVGQFPWVGHQLGINFSPGASCFGPARSTANSRSIGGSGQCISGYSSKTCCVGAMI